MDLVGNDVDTLHEEIEYLVGHLVENDVDTFVRIYGCYISDRRLLRQGHQGCGQAGDIQISTASYRSS